MKIYLILTAVLVFFSLTIPFALNEISEGFYEREESRTPSIGETSTFSEDEDKKETVSVFISSTGETIKTDMLDYIVGSVAGEMPASFSPEALKSQAVASYTYAKYVIENSGGENALISDSPLVHQSYTDKDGQKKKWGENYAEYRSKIEKAVNEVYGEYLTFEGKTALTAFHALSKGRTNSAEEIWGEAVPYLVSVSSLSYEDAEKTLSFTEEEFISLLEEKADLKLDGKEKIATKVTEKSKEGYIRKLKIEDKLFTAVEIKEIFSLPSASFYGKNENGVYSFTCFGKGHGVGMSQYGAEYMANEGKSYREILSHFYPGTAISKE